MKRILITGANRGYGLALAHAFSHSGYALYLVVRSEASREILLSCFPNACILVEDVVNDGYEARLNDWLRSVTLDVVINNAGVGAKAPTLTSTTTGDLRLTFDTNCVGVLSTVKGSLAALLRNQSAMIINISSRRGSLTMQSQLAAKGSRCSYAYRISKAAQNMLTLCLADELEESRIKVVSVHPGRLLTQMAASDARLSPEASAQKLVNLVEDNAFCTRDFIDLEDESRLPW